MNFVLKINKSACISGPSIHDEDTGLPLTGKAALKALLQHYHFYEHVGNMTKNCYLEQHTFDISNSTYKSPAHERLNCSEDSLYFWNSIPNISSASGSESTLSTIIHTGSSSTIGSDPRVAISDSSILVNVVDQGLNQGQTNNARTASLSSEEICVSVCVSDQCSLVTPSLLSAVCGLLENLLVMNSEDTVNALSKTHLLSDLTSLIKPAVLERCFSDLKASLTPEGRARKKKSQVLVLLDYLSSLSGFLHSYVLVDASLLIQDELIRSLLATLTSVLFTHHKKHLDAELKNAIYQTRTDIFMLLTTLLRKNGPAVIIPITEAVAKHGNAFFDLMSECVALAGSHPDLYSTSLQFLSVLLAEEGNHRLHESQTSTPLHLLLDGNLKIGNSLCKIILQSYEEKSLEDPLGQVCVNSLISLLAVSRSAQVYSLQVHFVDSCTEKLKYIHAQLNLESLRPGKSQKKKEESYLKQVKVTMHLLRNCLYKNEECKAAALECQLTSVLHSLWPWLLMDDALMHGALQLLCVYTANFAAACSCLCWMNTGVTAVQPSQKSQTSSSILHSILKIAAEPTSYTSHTQQVLFDLLSNLSGAQDCKCIIQKNNFLQHFLSLSWPKGGNKSLSHLANLWLKFLWNLSLSSDGQLMIMKMKGSLEILLELTKYKQKVKLPMVLLILHNICFNPANKPKILSNDNIVAELCACLESDSPNSQRIGASALWALLHNYQKAKVALKSPLLKGKIEEALYAMRKNETGLEDRHEVYHLKCLENLEQVLAN